MYDYPEMALEPRDPPKVAECPVCEDDICAGDTVLDDGGTLIHAECILKHICEEYQVWEICEALHILEVTAGV